MPGLSLGLIDETEVPKERAIVDVGAGWSTLVAHLLERGYTDLTAIDLSASAVRIVRDRLGPAGDDVILELADVLEMRGNR